MSIPPAISDPTHDYLRTARRSLNAVLAPKTVAIIGVTPDPAPHAAAVVANLAGSTFGGRVFGIGSGGPQSAVPVYPTLADAPALPELAVIVSPAAEVPAAVQACARAGVAGAIVLAGGFRERGPAGLALEDEVRAAAATGNLRLIGPNSLGIMRPPTGLNASFAAHMAQSGSVAFVSQSGALCNAILDWSLRENLGFSAFVSVGSMLDVGWGDLIDFLGDDPHTQSILLYMESVGDARSFLSAAREVTLSKPIIVLKAGRTASAARAAASHTGTLVGSDAVLDAAFERCGVLRVDTIAELFYMADVLAKQPRPRGPRLAIITNAGGPGVLATDALVRSGGALAPFAPATQAALAAALPPETSRDNPVDLMVDADPERYRRALEIVAADPNTDGVLVIRTPRPTAEPGQVAEVVARFAKLPGKPLLASWMGGALVESGTAVLSQARIPSFSYPDTAARMFTAMWRYSENLRGLYETPELPQRQDDPDLQIVAALLDQAREAGRTLLSEAESKLLLAAYGIAAVETLSAATPEQAVHHARLIGYPVVLKLASTTIPHKTDVGGVQLNLLDDEAVYRAFAAIQDGVAADDFMGVTVQPMVTDGYELILGAHVDPQFGPVLLFGAGGQLVEVLGDQALGLPPLTTTLARRMIDRTNIVRALRGIRGRPPSDLAALEALLVGFGQLVIEQPLIQSIDVNPLFARFGAQLEQPAYVALDARVVLHDPATPPRELPAPAIRPYPAQYVTTMQLKDGTSVTIRPIRPEDEPLMVRFHQTLSERSVYMRYFSALTLSSRIAHERLLRLCFIDYDRQMALVADRVDPATGEHALLAIGRIIKLRGKPHAEFAGIVSDQWQGHGLGTELLRQLIVIARDEGLQRIVAETMPENRGMQRVFEKLGFRLRRSLSEGVVFAELDLG